MKRLEEIRFFIELEEACKLYESGNESPIYHLDVPLSFEDGVAIDSPVPCHNIDGKLVGVYVQPVVMDVEGYIPYGYGLVIDRKKLETSFLKLKNVIDSLNKEIILT